MIPRLFAHNFIPVLASICAVHKHQATATISAEQSETKAAPCLDPQQGCLIFGLDEALASILAGYLPRRPASASSNGGVSSLVVHDGALLAFGIGNAGENQFFRFLKLQGAAKATQVAVDGAGTVFFCDDHGNLYKWMPRAQESAERMDVEAGRTFESVCCGASHCVAIANNGEAFSWATRMGGQRKGVLGRPYSNENELIPHKMDLPASAGRISSCACGSAHTVLLEEAGRLWTCGSDSRQQLGLGGNTNASHHNTPQLVNSITSPIVKVACGAEHTLAAARDGTVIAWGRGVEGQLGRSQNVYSSGVPQPASARFPPSFPIYDLGAGGNCSVVLLEDPQTCISLWFFGACPALSAPINTAAATTTTTATSPERAPSAGGEQPVQTRCEGKWAEVMISANHRIDQNRDASAPSSQHMTALAVVPVGADVGGGKCTSCRVQAKIMFRMMGR